MVTVLIVEDEKLIRKGLVAMVRRSSLPLKKVLEARNGEEALLVLQEEDVDLVLTDVQMPKMNGIELVERIKNLKDPPLVITVSGFDEFTYAVNMLRNGVKDYLLKPVEQEKLDQCMQRLYQPLQLRKNKANSHRNLLMMTLSYYMEHGADLDQQKQNALREIEREYLPQEYQVVCGKFDTMANYHDALVLKGREGMNVCICPAHSWCGEMQIVGYSKEHCGMQEVPTAYEEGMFAWKQSFFTGKAAVFQAVSGNGSLPEASHLMDLLRLSRWQELVCVLQQGGRLVAEGQLEPDRMFHLCEELVETVAEAYRELYEEQDDPKRFKNIWEFTCWQDYLQRFSQWLELFCQRMDQKFSDYESKQKILEAVKYVRANFCSSINMAMVSNEVSMNYSLFSVLFKQYTGKNFVTFLQNLRVDEAKKLLVETDMRVNEICSRVGFSGEKHFLKVFKAYVGVSPGDWRKLNRNRDV